LDFKSAAKFLQFYRSSLVRINTKIFALQTKQKELQQKHDKINTQLQHSNVPTTEERREVTVTIAAGSATNITLLLSYVISGAKWTSSYDVRVDTEVESKCELIYYGVITNSTHEDWKNVKVSLSTAAPSLGGEPSKLESMKLQFNPPRPNTILALPADEFEDDSGNESKSEEDDDVKKYKRVDKLQDIGLELDAKAKKPSKPKKKRKQNHFRQLPLFSPLKSKKAPPVQLIIFTERRPSIPMESLTK